jgi:hypothetical protein
MSERVVIELRMPEELASLHFPKGLDRRLQQLLDKRDRLGELSTAEQSEAEGLISVAEMLTLLQLKAQTSSKKAVGK